LTRARGGRDRKPTSTIASVAETDRPWCGKRTVTALGSRWNVPVAKSHLIKVLPAACRMLYCK
jgi:hypothetical protein